MRSRLNTEIRVALLVGWAIAAAVLGPAAGVAQEADSLTLDRIFAAPEFFGERFGPARWLDGDSYTTLERSQQTPGGRDIVRYDARSGEHEVLVPAAALVPPGTDRPLAVADYSWSDDRSKLLIFTNTRRVWRFNTRGDYWVLDLESGRLRQVGADRAEASLMYAKFSPDASRVAYVSENNLYVEGVASDRVIPLTADGSRTTLNGRFDWVYEEEFFLGSRYGADGFRWSPDGEHLAFWQLDASGVRDFLLINTTDSLYSYTIPVQYPKAGTTKSAARVGIVPADGGETTWLAVDADPRDNYIARMGWSGRSDAVAIQHLNRVQNTNRVMLGDARTGAVRTVLAERDEAWLDPVDFQDWLDHGARFTWMSERDGWQRVYVVDRSGDGVRPITPPGTDVIAINLIDEEGGWLFYSASPDNPTQQYLFRVPLDGSMQAERLSPHDMQGWHSYQLSTTGRHAIHVFSTFDTPPTITLVELPSHRPLRTLVENADLKEKLAAAIQRPAEFFRVDVGEGVELDGWVIKPNDFDPSQRYPVLFYGYGHPWGQTVVDRWSGSRRLWHQYLTQLGYVVMSLDNRGTPAPRGREWRKVAYKQVGIISSQDQANGVRAAIDSFPFVVPERIGVWGWSGGGSLTLDCLFRYPEVYHTGMAVASVPEYRYYDTIYQERYLGLPRDDPEAYEQNSPITFAHQLRGNLLLVHGTGDDNVHYQGVEALINKLVEHGKHFSMMAYPNRSHGIFEGRGTTRHLYGLMTRYLLDNLPAGGR